MSLLNNAQQRIRNTTDYVNRVLAENDRVNNQDRVSTQQSMFFPEFSGKPTKKRKKNKKRRHICVGEGNPCPKCGEPMERRKHRDRPKSKKNYYTEWDYCVSCRHLQHYGEFRRGFWAQVAELDDRFNSINF